MAHQTFSKAIHSLLSKKITSSATRRGYASVSQSGPEVGSSSGPAKEGAGNMMKKKNSQESGKSAWMPDPTSGFYRPGNAANEVDPAQLRDALLKNKPGSGQ